MGYRDIGRVCWRGLGNESEVPAEKVTFILAHEYWSDLERCIDWDKGITNREQVWAKTMRLKSNYTFRKVVFRCSEISGYTEEWNVIGKEAQELVCQISKQLIPMAVRVEKRVTGSLWAWQGSAAASLRHGWREGRSETGSKEPLRGEGKKPSLELFQRGINQ